MYILLGVMVVLFLLASWWMLSPVTVITEEKVMKVQPFPPTTAAALAAAGIKLAEADRVEPGLGALRLPGASVRVTRARAVVIWEDGEVRSLQSASRLPVFLLAAAGVALQPEDELLWNGKVIEPHEVLPLADTYTLQVVRGGVISIEEGGNRRVINTAVNSSTGQALWQAGVRLRAGDMVSQPLDRVLRTGMNISLQRSRPVTIILAGQTIFTRSLAKMVGQALADAGVGLQGEDYSLPAEEMPLPDDGEIRVVRVKEEVLLKENAVPYKTSQQADPKTELDQRSVIQAGQVGLRVSRERIRYEDGLEVSRKIEAEWEAVPPRDQINGFGTKVVVKTTQTPDGTIEYYRAVEVYATSYSPCRTGLEKCSYSTASGIRLTKGIVAVSLPWYRSMAGQRVYIPGYGVGVIADTGGGIPGRYWIDLGYDEDNFVNWHQTVTLYFLTPVPGNVLWILP
ncbi:MAG TPA: ubiquitin-like domain-containing protein [Anaerolineaceae bacterium]